MKTKSRFAPESAPGIVLVRVGAAIGPAKRVLGENSRRKLARKFKE